MVLFALASALVYQAWALGITVDEPSHLLSAALYWRGADNLRPQDMPPLIKIVGGWVPHLLDPPIPFDNSELWATQHEWPISREMIQRMQPAHLQRLIFLSRLPLILFPLLTTLLLWRWARNLFIPAVGVLLAVIYAIEPTALGHGALFKNDIAATLAYLAFWYAAWRFWKEPGLHAAGWLGASLLLAITTKLSLLILAPVAPALVLLRHLRGAWNRRACLAQIFLVLTIPYLGVITAYKFDAVRIRKSELRALAANQAAPKAMLTAANLFRLLPVPRPMWNGVHSVLAANARDNPVYFLGRIEPNGHPMYFLTALAVKSPTPVLLLLLTGIALTAWSIRKGRFDARNLFWLGPPILYIGLASAASLQLGIRLILPALPFGLLIAGVSVRRMLDHRASTAVLACLLLWLAIQSAAFYPRGISFFNLPSGGPDRALHYLADSNLDWGQDLPALAALVRRNEISSIRLSYFGGDNPYRLLPEQQLEVVPPPWSPHLAMGPHLKVQPGRYYAVSANLLPGHFFAPEYRDYYRPLRKLKPIAKAGYSIYIYRVPE
ncbi:MAG: glycosyltransferase family 39 protein [Bryobacteraceae bacterium]